MKGVGFWEEGEREASESPRSLEKRRLGGRQGALAVSSSCGFDVTGVRGGAEGACFAQGAAAGHAGCGRPSRKLLFEEWAAAGGGGKAFGREGVSIAGPSQRTQARVAGLGSQDAYFHSF